MHCQNNNHPFSAGVILALGSNVCLGLRNICTKYFLKGEEIKKSRTTVEGFATISLAGLVSLLPMQLFVLLRSRIEVDLPGKFIEYSAGTNFYSMAIFLNSQYNSTLLANLSHVLYNLISLACVLSAFNPLQHAFLSVTRRVTVVTLFCLLAPVSPSLSIFSGGMCLLVSILGTQVNRRMHKL